MGKQSSGIWEMKYVPFPAEGLKRNSIRFAPDSKHVTTKLFRPSLRGVQRVVDPPREKTHALARHALGR